MIFLDERYWAVCQERKTWLVAEIHYYQDALEMDETLGLRWESIKYRSQDWSIYVYIYIYNINMYNQNFGIPQIYPKLVSQISDR